MRARSARRGVNLVIKSVVSFRLLLAVATSTSVTAAVAGPMAYEAAQARDQTAVTIAPPTSASTTTTTTTTRPLAPVVTPGSIGAIATAAMPTISPLGLQTSRFADHRDASPLDTETRLYGRVWLFFDGAGATSVTYWLDDPTATSSSIAVRSQPFDVSPEGIDMRSWGPGRHTLTAEIRTVGGTYRRQATFLVIG